MAIEEQSANIAGGVHVNRMEDDVGAGDQVYQNKTNKNSNYIASQETNINRFQRDTNWDTICECLNAKLSACCSKLRKKNLHLLKVPNIQYCGSHAYENKMGSWRKLQQDQ